MLDYEKKYLDLTSGLNQCIPDVSSDFPDADGFEKAVISMRKLGWNYGNIQKVLGMPSKKSIRNVLLKWCPELIDNSKKKIVTVSSNESELYNILAHTDKIDFEIEGEDCKFYIENHKIIFEDWDGFKMEYSKLDPVSQTQFLIQIKEQLC